MLRCFVLIIVLPIFCLSALAAEPAVVPLTIPLAAPIEPRNAAPLAVAPVNPSIRQSVNPSIQQYSMRPRNSGLGLSRHRMDR